MEEQSSRNSFQEGPYFEDEKSNKNARPIAISIICVLGFIGCLASVFLLFQDFAFLGGNFFSAYLIFSIVAGFLSFIGLWQMKKWGLHLYVLLTVGVQIISYFFFIDFNLKSIIVPAIVIGIAFSHYEKMT